ncbi:alcohol dehydrogenase [Oleiphilus sp. HI0009]|uniref:iron-containing alcohol dehydrogenase n=2 Tax=Oleiphilus TaxID=141450 RepID=UPI0007C2E144|nr:MULTISPECIES: iron-containing alcohol dehydrogenase [unclassified Oleiphilus]KZX76390.1 alcohol dehydrogenase [Oleiphilus sp. HI0009]KZY65429.1 alcohol dehydrogenase [Oleiphilus sp. HI0066]KZY69944.1 alcohol dehydrogenase [Oleiphilus sp. HI0066]KZY71959.1 alcohol dehydrogenase [Oleiphilus sp. HI0067]
MNSFTFSTSQHIRCGNGLTDNLGELCVEHGYNHVMIVTDFDIKRLGLLDKAIASFEQNKISYTLFSEVEPDPAEEVVLRAIEQAKKLSVDVIIGFGGGSSMDVAKLIALLAHPQCTQSLDDIYGVGNAKGIRLPLIQIPTTAGTGSEVTPVAIVTTGDTTKMGAVSPIFLPDLALLDANLTIGLPPHVTAATGVDAMVHAIEAYTSVHKKNPISDMLAREALSLLTANIFTATHHGHVLEAREKMLLGALYAGQAFANSPVAAVHALAYPLGGHFHIPHGLSNSLVLPYVLRFNVDSAAEQYAQLAPVMFPDQSFTGTNQDICEQWIDQIENLIKDLGLPSTLREMNIEESFLPTLAKDAMLQTRLLVNNPRDVSYEDALTIYHAAF